MGVKERIIEYIEYREITTRSFERNSGLSNGYVQRFKGNIGAEKLEQILNAYPDINRSWLLTGQGDMLKPAKNPFSQMTEKEIESITGETIAEELMKLLKSGEVFLAATHHKIVDEKNEEFAKLYLRLEKSQRENWELQRKIDELTR